ncbi:hypothetical protein [Chryseobacterium paludis]|uniref:hypothetical protein n=1 Tax=Chryseobacterium paludis TaxID=2956784 RepID=UPI0021BF63CD|nr:hypothetical protein [Chryseobacterium paludis]
MKNYKVFFFLILTLFVQIVKAQEVKKPAEVFGLYFDTFLRYNNEGVAKLNDYLRPTVEGKDSYQANIKEISEGVIKTSAENFLLPYPKNVAIACKKESEDYFKVLYENFQNAKMSVKKVELVQNEYVPDQKIARIQYSVTFKVPSKISEVIIPDSDKVKPEELKAFLTDIIEKFKNADKIVTTEQEFSLYELKHNGKIYYWNGSPDQIVSTLTDFYFESFGVK